MGCLRGSKFTCILFFVPRPPVVPASLFPSGPWSSSAAARAVATPRCSSETPRATIVLKTGFP